MVLNKMYERILEKIDTGIHVIDSDGKTIIYNEKMKEIEGMEVDDVLDKNLLDVFSFHQNEDSTLMAALKWNKTSKNVKQTYFNNKGQMITTINDTFPIIEDGIKIGAIEIARDVTKLEKLIRENIEKKGSAKYTFDSIVGTSSVLQEVIENSKRATRTSSSVLIIGETGTGKELFAQSIHNGSLRSSRPFISQNCAALPDTLIEGLLFGTKKGAFTGAIERPGLFEQAEGGTLLLDEINSLNPALQAKLLRVIQERTVRRIGDTKDRNVDVRIIATINEDPIDAIAEGRLRKDLYYRLSVVSLFIPPLRERRRDIEDLVYYFIEKYSRLFGMSIESVNEDVMNLFLEHEWPGNVRELEHVIEGTMNLLEYENCITLSHLPPHFRNKPALQTADEIVDCFDKDHVRPLENYMEDTEKLYLKKVLELHEHNVTQAAAALHMSRQNLQYRIRKHGLRR